MQRIYIVGDSISVHYGPYLERYLRGIISYARKSAGEAVALDTVPFHEHIREKQGAFVAGWLAAWQAATRVVEGR